MAATKNIALAFFAAATFALLGSFFMTPANADRSVPPHSAEIWR